MNLTAQILDGRYRLGPLLGQGGMSDVYMAEDQRTRPAVAVKVVRSGDPDLARRLAQEARALERLQHPRLIRLLDTGVADSQAYLVMELVVGKPLSQLLRRGPLDTGRTAKLGSDLAGALAYVHGRGIVHRDVKPSNILVTPHNQAQLGDFGIAKLLDSSTLTMAGTTLGTAAYMAPEQLENHDVAPSADVWSLGMVLVECLTGRPIYEGSPREVVARRLAGPVSLPNNLPVAWKLLVTGMLDERPEHRLSSQEVSALLTTLPFRVPWSDNRPDKTEPLPSTMRLDPASSASGLTRTAVLDRVNINASGSTPYSRLRESKWSRVVALGSVAAAGLLVAALLGFGSSPATGHTPASRTTPDLHSATTLKPTAPTATVNRQPLALTALVKDVESAVGLGSIDPAIGQAVTTQAEKAVAYASEGRSKVAADYLQQAVLTISNGVQRGKVTPKEGGALRTDLSTLAAALGLAQPVTPPSNPQGPGDGQKPGHGHDHGDGGG